ncbi:hypothetical protein [Paraliobacillus sp. X-1268]|uniref:hypothetical protein n=1 Tax=Paraliobacillus sp. X-1268 TaxID=2213193 RepID=UPI000E3E57B7|nr:hypothetical protein [Paraliobacillus sp. X-1268]
MIINELKKECSDVVNDYVRDHKNYKLMRRLRKVNYLLFVPLLFMFLFLLTGENLELSFFSLFSFIVTGIAYINIDTFIYNMLVYRDKDIEKIYKKFKPKLERRKFDLQQLNFLEDQLKEQINKIQKGSTAILVISSAASLPIWQGLIKLIIENDNASLLVNITILMLLLIFMIVFLISLKNIYHFMFKNSNGNLILLEKSLLFIQEYRLDNRKVNNTSMIRRLRK